MDVLSSWNDLLFFTDSKYDIDNSKKFSVPIPESWEEVRESEWTILIPLNNNMQRQGWKVHISSTMLYAEEVLTLVSQYCYEKNIVFKHLSTIKRFANRNGKLMPREHAGKFITCYPDEILLEKFLAFLEEKLQDYPGPYILSDKRWLKGPIYLRYGMFKKESLNTHGVNSDKLEINGQMVRDNREAYFVRPDDSVVPTFLKNWLTTKEENSEKKLPFDIKKAIRFSNSGGIYEGVFGEKMDRGVFIKEARPYTGIDDKNLTAIDRLSIEAKALKQLEDVDQVPKLLWEGEIWEHYFLVMEKIEGMTLNQWIVKNYPIYSENEPDFINNFLLRAHKIIQGIELFFEASHEKGVYHQDVHPKNFIIDFKDAFSVIDWEQAVFNESDERYHTVAAPGFRQWNKTTPEAIDWYGVSQIAHSIFFPVVIQSDLVYGFSKQQEKSGKELFLKLGADKKLLNELLNTLCRLRDKAGKVEVLTEQKNLHLYLDKYDTPENFEHLMKGLIFGFDKTIRRWKYSYRHFPVHYYGLTNQHGLAFSDLGILWAYCTVANRIGILLSSDFQQLKTKTISNLLYEIENNQVVDYSFGEGASGSLWLMHKLGESQKAAKLFQKKFKIWWEATENNSIYNGKAGILLVGLELTSMGLFDQAFENEILNTARNYAKGYLSSPEMYSSIGKGKVASNNPNKIEAGLLYGHASFGWLFAELYRYTEEEVFLEGLNVSISNEFKGYYTDETNKMQYSQGHRILPYLSMGSAGLGILISENFDIVDSHYTENLESLYRAVDANFSVSPSLFNGYVGLKLGQFIMNKNLRKDSQHELFESTYQGLSQHLIKFGDGLCVAGDNGMRLTTDIASGFAGVIIALESIATDKFIMLPKSFKERR